MKGSSYNMNSSKVSQTSSNIYPTITEKSNLYILYAKVQTRLKNYVESKVQSKLKIGNNRHSFGIV